ncbi:MAG: host specificity protein, partial [Pseudomonadota bacterium]
FLDLPMMTGDEQPHAPHVAVTADPWPGLVRIMHSATDTQYSNKGLMMAPSIMGTTTTPLAAAPHGIYDHGPGVEVDLTAGSLASTTAAGLLAGANLAAIGDGSADNWEVFQFETATPLGGNQFRLTRRLRGQLGTDALMPSVWPAGSVFVVLGTGITHVDLPANSRGVGQFFKFGATTVDLTHPSVVSMTLAFAGNGLRPYAPSHLVAVPNGSDLEVSWVRRTRLDGDAWTANEPPLHEAYERYRVDVIANGALVRSLDVTASNWTYVAADQAADGVSGLITVRVAQISDSFGPGLYRSINVIV